MEFYTKPYAFEALKKGFTPMTTKKKATPNEIAILYWSIGFYYWPGYMNHYSLCSLGKRVHNSI